MTFEVGALVVDKSGAVCTVREVNGETLLVDFKGNEISAPARFFTPYVPAKVRLPYQQEK
jgi:hypothetical protein